MSGHEFEGYIASYLNANGFAAKCTRATGDGGIDVNPVFTGPSRRRRSSTLCLWMVGTRLNAGVTVTGTQSANQRYETFMMPLLQRVPTHGAFSSQRRASRPAAAAYAAKVGIPRFNSLTGITR
jgi:hypothetical protein